MRELTFRYEFRAVRTTTLFRRSERVPGVQARINVSDSNNSPPVCCATFVKTTLSSPYTGLSMTCPRRTMAPPSLMARTPGLHNSCCSQPYSSWEESDPSHQRQNVVDKQRDVFEHQEGDKEGNRSSDRSDSEPGWIPGPQIRDAEG